MIQQIPLNGGLVTQVDGEEVSIKACTELINAEFDKPGIIYKRRGGNDTVDTGKTFVSITRWYNPNIGGNYYWIGIDSSDNVWHSTNLTSWTEISFDSSDALCLGGSPITDDTEVVKLVNYNTQLRFPCGLTDDARIYQYIDRDFFWSGEEGTPAFYSDIARPRDVFSTNLATDIEPNSGWFWDGSDHIGATALDLTTDTYYYRWSYVFDGNQESPLTSGNLSTGTDTGEKIPYLSLNFDTGSSLANWNKRVTAINVYRSNSFAGPFYKIGTVSTKVNDSNITTLTTQPASAGLIGKYIYLTDSNGEVTTNFNSKKLLFNGHTHTFESSAGLENGLYLLNSATGSTAYDGSSDAEADDRMWGDSWAVVDSNLFTVSQNGTFETSTTLATDGYVGVNTTLDTGNTKILNPSSGTALVGSKTLYIGTTSGTATLHCPVISISSNTEYYIECWVRPDTSGTTTGTALTMTSGTGTSATSSSNYTGVTTSTTCTITHSNHTSDTYKLGNGKTGWEKLSFTITSDGNDTKLSVKFSVTSDNHFYYIDQLTVGKVVGTGDKGYAGVDVITTLTDELGDNNSHIGYVLLNGDSASMGTSSNKRGWVSNNTRRAIQIYNDTTFPYNNTAVGNTTILSENYMWRKSGDNQRLIFFDKNLPNGTEHPTFETSLDVKHRHSKYINGRNYVADVRITDGTDTEDHGNWVMFSELNQPDVIPITNYIQLTDAQGGRIIGIESLMGDLAVLMERGIYRLSIPSEDPTAWSLSESEENIGCLSENSITAWESGLFFAGEDHLYYLDVNFNATPITTSIKDDYQSAITSSARTFYDVKKNRLLCRFGADGGTIYSLDLSMFPEERWTKVVSGSSDMDIFTLNEDLTLYSYDNGTQEIKSHIVSTSLLNEPTSFKRTTGWISQSNLDRSGVLRRLNLKYKSGDPITAKIYIDGDDTTVISTITIPADTTGADWYKCKPNVRCRSYKVELSTTTTLNEVEIRRIEVEFE